MGKSKKSGKVRVKKDEDKSSEHNELPSKINDKYWVHAFPEIPQEHSYKIERGKTGKWLLFVDKKLIDEVWSLIKEATERGDLGIAAKVATAKVNKNSSSENERVICVYTGNWEDEKDVYRVARALRDIGIDSTLFYKTDEDTLSGAYKVNGSKNISKYISEVKKKNVECELEALNGLGNSKIEILNSIGINNIDDLMAYDTLRRLEGVGVSNQYIKKLKLLALSQLENQIFKLQPVILPSTEIVHFDIETDLISAYSEKRVWSVALHHKEKVTKFFAETWDQEGTILSDFMNYIKDLENPSLICYSGCSFDKNVLAHAFRRHDLDANYFLSCNHYDLCTILKRNYVMPLKSNGLKDVGEYLGYEFKNSHLSGLRVAMEYIQCQRSGTPLSKDIFHYIEDDVKAMDFILNQLKIRQDIKDLFDTDVKL